MSIKDFRDFARHTYGPTIEVLTTAFGIYQFSNGEPVAGGALTLAGCALMYDNYRTWDTDRRNT